MDCFGDCFTASREVAFCCSSTHVDHRICLFNSIAVSSGHFAGVVNGIAC